MSTVNYDVAVGLSHFRNLSIGIAMYVYISLRVTDINRFTARRKTGGMTERSLGGPTRLRGAGVGSIVGGLCLGLFSVFVPYTLATLGTLAFGLGSWLVQRRTATSRAGVAFGCTAVGGIGVLEAAGAGVGIGPFFLAAVAIGAGAVDVFVGGLLGRIRADSDGE